MVKKYGDLYLEARQAFLANEDQQTASLLARNLLCSLSGRSQEQIIFDRETYASEEICRGMEASVGRILSGEPLAYVLGEWDFYGLTFKVDKNVLIPRDDSCAVAALAIKYALFLDNSPRILDLCTGSGCLGIAIAYRVKDARVTLADISKEALGVAKSNVAMHKLSGRVSCVQADALNDAPAFLGKFDLIISNPPYITRDEMLELPDSVRLYEPHLALFGGNDGLDFYRAISEHYAKILKPGGYLCFEFGMGQGNDICKILKEKNFTVLERTLDYNGIERAVIAQLHRKEE